MKTFLPKSGNFAAKWRNCGTLFRRLLPAGIMAPVLLLSSCAVRRTVQSSQVESAEMRTDSVSLAVERITKAIPVPASRAKLTLSFDSLRALPAGAEFRATQGQATVTVLRSEGGITASADCDSLTLLVDELKTEIFHLNKEKMTFQSELSEQKIIEVNRLTGWQSFQIWTGRLCLALVVIITGIKLFKIIKL
jgi:hypothetical protein